MTEDDEIDGWADSPGALDFMRDLKMKRKAQVDSLVGAASVSTDPLVRANWAAIQQLDIIIRALEAERGIQK